jgi:tetratricopeptide (TPR) repeat protein
VACLCGFSIIPIYFGVAEVGDAEKLYQWALQGKEKAWGPEHTSTLNTVKNLGRLNEAEKMYQRALDSYAKVVSPDNLMTNVLALSNM